MDWDKVHQKVQHDCIDRVTTLWNGIYEPDLYAPMGREKILSDLLVNDRSGIFYIAPSGAGKSSLFCKLAVEWSEAHLVFLTGLSMPLSSESSLSEYIGEYFKINYEIDLANQLNEFIEFLNQNNKKCIIMIDSIDECCNVEEIKRALHHTIVHYNRDPIKLVINCRNVMWKLICNNTWSKSLQVIYWKADEEESFFREPFLNYVIQNYFDKYKISFPIDEKVKEFCRYPILLRFFSQVNSGKKSIETCVFRAIDMCMGYVSGIVHQIVKEIDDSTAEEIVSFIEVVAMAFWTSGCYSISKKEIQSQLGNRKNFDQIYCLLIKYGILRELQYGLENRISFVYQMALEHQIANFICKKELWAEKTAELLRKDLKNFINANRNNYLLMPVLEFVFLIFEILGKQNVMISLLMGAEFSNDFKMMLSRAVMKMGQVDIETWQMLRCLEQSADSDVKSEVKNAVQFLGENIPGDQVFHSLMLLQNHDKTVLQRHVIARLKYDSNFIIFVKQLEPYSRLPEIQSGLIEFVKLLKVFPIAIIRLPILNLADLILKFNADEGLEHLVFLADHTKDDAAFLDAWVNIACDNADGVFLKLIKTYISVVKNDRLKWDRIFRFCLAGGHNDSATSLKLIAQGFNGLSNHQLMLSTMNFIGKFGVADPDSASAVLTLAQKKAKAVPAAKQMELREKIAVAAIDCFRKNNRSFAKVISELVACEDLKVKELIIKELNLLKKAISN